MAMRSPSVKPLFPGPSNGTVTLSSGGTYTYTPTLGFTGGDSFVYRVLDGKGGSDTGTVTISVLAPRTAVIKAATTSPTIDGSIDPVWSSANLYNLSNIVLGLSAPTPIDLAGSFRALHDGINLYLLIEVADEQQVNDSAVQNWQDDAIEIYLDGNLSGGSKYDRVDDRQMVFRWNDPENYVSSTSAPRPADLPA